MSTIEVLNDVAEFLEDQSDVVDGDDGAPAPNKAMSLLLAVECEIENLTSRAVMHDPKSPQPEGTTISPLERYGLAVLEAHRQDFSDLDGAFLQEEAERCGLLYCVEVTEPCGEYCRCSEYEDFPQQCLRLKPEFEPKMSEHRKERYLPQKDD